MRTYDNGAAWVYEKPPGGRGPNWPSPPRQPFYANEPGRVVPFNLPRQPTQLRRGNHR